MASASPSYTGLAETLSKRSASPWAPLLVVVLVAGWAVVGFSVHFAEWWIIAFHLAIGAGSLGLLFLLHHIHRRDTNAIQLKLNELVAAHDQASNDLVDIERNDGNTLEAVREESRGRRPSEALGRAGSRGDRTTGGKG